MRSMSTTREKTRRKPKTPWGFGRPKATIRTVETREQQRLMVQEAKQKLAESNKGWMSQFSNLKESLANRLTPLLEVLQEKEDDTKPELTQVEINNKKDDSTTSIQDKTSLQKSIEVSSLGMPPKTLRESQPLPIDVPSRQMNELEPKQHQFRLYNTEAVEKNNVFSAPSDVVRMVDQQQQKSSKTLKRVPSKDVPSSIEQKNKLFDRNATTTGSDASSLLFSRSEVNGGGSHVNPSVSSRISSDFYEERSLLPPLQPSPSVENKITSPDLQYLVSKSSFIETRNLSPQSSYSKMTSQADKPQPIVTPPQPKKVSSSTDSFRTDQSPLILSSLKSTESIESSRMSPMSKSPVSKSSFIETRDLSPQSSYSKMTTQPDKPQPIVTPPQPKKVSSSTDSVKTGQSPLILSSLKSTESIESSRMSPMSKSPVSKSSFIETRDLSPQSSYSKMTTQPDKPQPIVTPPQPKKVSSSTDSFRTDQSPLILSSLKSTESIESSRMSPMSKSPVSKSSFIETRDLSPQSSYSKMTTQPDKPQPIVTLPHPKKVSSSIDSFRTDQSPLILSSLKYTESIESSRMSPMSKSPVSKFSFIETRDLSPQSSYSKMTTQPDKPHPIVTRSQPKHTGVTTNSFETDRSLSVSLPIQEQTSKQKDVNIMMAQSVLKNEFLEKPEFINTLKTQSNLYDVFKEQPIIHKAKGNVISKRSSSSEFKPIPSVKQVDYFSPYFSSQNSNSKNLKAALTINKPSMAHTDLSVTKTASKLGTSHFSIIQLPTSSSHKKWKSSLSTTHHTVAFEVVPTSSSNNSELTHQYYPESNSTQYVNNTSEVACVIQSLKESQMLCSFTDKKKNPQNWLNTIKNVVYQTDMNKTVPRELLWLIATIVKFGDNDNWNIYFKSIGMIFCERLGINHDDLCSISQFLKTIEDDKKNEIFTEASHLLPDLML